MTGYVEATRESDAEKNRLCPPSPYSSTLADWARMQVLGYRASASFGAEPDIKAWADRVALNPARIPPGREDDVEVCAALDRLGAYVVPGMTRMAELAGMSPVRAGSGR